MVYSLTYRRPPFVRPLSAGSERPESVISSARSTDSATHGIPDALSFDRIISGGTCPPVTTKDFMNYLIYIERSAENLQFFLWYREYVQRFEMLPASEHNLAPEWTKEQADSDATAPPMNSGINLAILKGTDFAPGSKPNTIDLGNSPFQTPPRSPNPDQENTPSSYAFSNDGITLKSSDKSIQEKTASAFDHSGIKWQPFTIQPFREEISRIIATYIADGSQRQLNLSSKERSALLHALGNTTHPSAFQNVIQTAEWSLRRQAHPNFIRWTIGNGNRPRVTFARSLGVGGIVAGIATGILLCLSSAGRGWRVISMIGLMIGISTLIAAWKGMCVVLHGMHHRHLRPWELFADEDEICKERDSLDTIGSSNSYEDEPWVAKYEKRNVIRKIFDREVWIQEPALRQIQDTIFVQALLGSFVISAIITGIFCAVPKGNFY
ncbi:MAG: hypothetical protein M1834_009250 [Cirrosporium novae-zelandiae]|nr:MAG: hypothetical protein M1834_009250 [Cirrosporium novae-zelandiae]